MRDEAAPWVGHPHLLFPFLSEHGDAPSILNAPFDLEGWQAGRVEAGVAVAVGDFSFGQEVGCGDDSFWGEVEFLGYAAAGFVPAGVGDSYAAHAESFKGVAEQGVGGFGGEASVVRGLADPEAGVAFAGFPIDIVEAGPDDWLAGCDLDAD